MKTGVIVERHEAFARVVLDRPEAMNAIEPRMAKELSRVLAEIAQDASIRCVLLAGSGAHFMAGGDIRYFAELLQLGKTERDGKLGELVSDVGEAVARLRAMGKPVIAAPRGAAAGFGFSLMCACDYVLASETLVCKLAYGQLGTTPDGGGSHNLPRLIGTRKAMEMALLDEALNATQAQQLGLVNRVVPDAALDDAALELAQRLAAKATVALGQVKHLINTAFERDLEGQLEAELSSFLTCADTEDFAAGVDSFLNKRKAQFHGR